LGNPWGIAQLTRVDRPFGGVAVEIASNGFTVLYSSTDG
jgi:hypothetical protein